MTLDIIKKPFAFQGDLTTPNQTSPTGFVNFQDGYTKDYEISLAAGNPQAKAVERMVQNYMFNQATEHAQAWQRQNMPPWFAGMSDVAIGGYPLNAMVIRQQADLSWKPYRSLVAANVSDPLTTPSQWEYMRTEAESLALVPMPSGAGNAAAELISVGVDFNTLTASGTYEVKVESVAAACSNLPTLDGSNVPGMLEVKSWNDGTSLRVIQIYTSTASRVFSRSAVGAVWSAWTSYISNVEYRSQKFTFCTATVPVSPNAIVLAANPVMSTRYEGMRLRFMAVGNNTGATTINDGISVKPLVGLGGSALIGGEIKTNFDAVIEWNVSLDSWFLVSSQSAPMQVATGSYAVASAAQFDNTTKLATMAALKKMGLQASSVVTLSANTTLTTTHAGASVASVGAASNITWTLPVASTFPAGARIELVNLDAITVTISRQSTDVISGGASNVLTSFAIPPGTFATIESNGAGSWWVVDGSAIIPTAAQFASTQQSVNAAFVQRALGNFSNRINIATSQAMTTAMAGNTINLSGSGTSVSLPLAAQCPAVAIMIEGGTANNTLTVQGSDQIATGQTSVTSVTIPAGESLWLVSNGVSLWRMLSGTVYNTYSGLFGNSISASGYQKLPSGIIIQWGEGSTNASGQLPITFPIAFTDSGTAYRIVAMHSGTGAAVCIERFDQRGLTGTRIDAFTSNTGSPVGSGLIVRWIAIGR